MLPGPLAIVTRIRRGLRDRRNFRAWQAALATWRAAHPAGDCAQFYAWYACQRLRTGRHLPQTLGSDINQRFQRRRALAMRALLVGLGLRPDHAVLDHGCGSLWIGEALIEYLDPGRYTGLDVIEDFWREALARLDPALVAAKRPNLGLLDAAPDAAAAPPDLVLATAVLMHVPPEELGGFFARLLARAGPRTRVLVDHDLDRPDGFRGTVWQHSRATVERHLARHGRTVAPSRHAAPVPGYRYRILLCELVPPA
ncbi:MAG: hypothetical protein AB7I59_20520 [Geminicoccaceae bacterium]